VKPWWLLSLGALSFAGWVSRDALREWLAPAGPEERPRVASPIAERALPQVSTLYEQRASAYHAGLFVDESGVVLVTPTGLTTLLPGEGLEEHAIDLGPLAVRNGGSVVFWRSGSLREISLSGAGEREVAALPGAPLYLLASEGQLAWIQLDRKTGSSIQTLSGGDVRVVYDSEKKVCASAMRGASVYWVLQSQDGSWTIDRVSLDGQQRISTAAHHGRPPSMLALGQDGVYFYDGPERGVRKLTFDLAREDVVLANVICSPIAVSSRVVCAHVGGLFEIARPGAAPRLLASEAAGPIAATAATNDRAFWVAESGDHLVVRSVALSDP
jgi:hypothetical protein